MTEDAAKIILLTGAPLSNSLDWTESSLCCPLQGCFEEHTAVKLIALSPSTARPTWRNLPLYPKYLPSGLTQLALLGDDARGETQETYEETSFLTVTDISALSDASNDFSSQEIRSSNGNDDDALTQFYEHSYAIHEELPALNVFSLDSTNDISMFSIDAVEEQNEIAQQGSYLTQRVAQPKPRSVNVIRLHEIPNSLGIRGLSSSTMSVDLIVGILSISPPRLIKTKKYGRMVELVEMTVADDSKIGFGITVWLPLLKPNSAANPQEEKLHADIAKFRPQDIILARNVALNSFRGKVYGQSLRKGITKLDLLYRNTMDSHDEPGAYSLEELNRDVADPQVIKIQKVKEWIMSFVGPGRRPPVSDTMRKRRSVNQGRPQLPADTQ